MPIVEENSYHAIDIEGQSIQNTEMYNMKVNCNCTCTYSFVEILVFKINTNNKVFSAMINKWNPKYYTYFNQYTIPIHFWVLSGGCKQLKHQLDQSQPMS